MHATHLLSFTWFLYTIHASVSPTRVFDGIEYYTSQRVYDFETEAIFCGASHCIVECNHKAACSNARIFAFEQQQLTVQCNGNSSCSNAHINAPTADSVQIYCYPNTNDSMHSTCTGMEVFCPSSHPNACNIDGSLCNDFQITVNDWMFDDSYLNINECLTNKQNETGISVSCHSKYTKSELFYNSETSQIECKYNNNRYCCPFRQSGGSCSNTNDEKCNVLCDFQHESDGCSYRVLQSKDDDTPLNVECTRYGSCDNTIVYCPLHADCTFLCTIHESCGSVEIISENEGTAVVDVTCVDTGGGYDVCIGAAIKAPKVHTLNVTMSGGHNVVIMASNVPNLVNITFLPYSSNNLIYAEYAENVKIHTFGRFALYGGSHVFANHSNALSMWCNAYYSHDKKGASYASDTSCNHVGIYRFNTVLQSRLKCESFGCGNLTIVSTNGLNDFVVEYNGCGACQSLEECFAKEHIRWDVRCIDVDENSIVSDTFDGVSCALGTCCDNASEEMFKDVATDCLDLSDPALSNGKTEL
eukprot:39130_1